MTKTSESLKFYYFFGSHRNLCEIFRCIFKRLLIVYCVICWDMKKKEHGVDGRDSSNESEWLSQEKDEANEWRSRRGKKMRSP